MVSEPTVLVLGAGASMPYGYPSGSALVDRMLGQLSPHSEAHVHAALEYFGYDKLHIEAFRKVLFDSRRYSIDAFLQAHSQEFGEIGKACIAAALIPSEQRPLFDTTDPDHWYRYLSNILADNYLEGKKSPLTVLTFNYDRSLEHFLYVALGNSLKLSAEELVKLFNERMRVIHLHGILSPLPWMTSSGSPVRPYGDQNKDLWRPACGELRIVHDEVEGNESFGLAREAVRSARRLCFLGFGYHPLNVKRLLPTGSFDGALCIGTAYDQRAGEIEKIQSLVGRAIRLGEPEKKCLDFLRTFRGVLD